jgi:hypothetical protein
MSLIEWVLLHVTNEYGLVVAEEFFYFQYWYA